MDNVITTVADNVPCNTLAPTIFLVGNNWISKTPQILSALVPTQIHPQLSIHNFSFVDNIINRGLYSSDSLANYSKFLTHFSRKKMAMDGIITKLGDYHINGDPTYDNFMTSL